MVRARYSALQKEYWGYTGIIQINGKRYKKGTVGEMERIANRLINSGITKEDGIQVDHRLNIFYFIHRRN